MQIAIKKLFCILLSCISCFTIVCPSISAFAEDEHKFVYIDILNNGKIMRSQVIQEKDKLYLSSQLLSEITNFYYNQKRKVFVHDGNELGSGYREIWIQDSHLWIATPHPFFPDPEAGFPEPMPFIQKSIECPAPIQANDDIYFSCSEILPALNVNANVVENVLHVDTIPDSLTEILSSIDWQQQIYQTYYGDDILGLSYEQVLYGYSYLLTGLTDFSVKRLVVDFTGANWGKIDEFKEILTLYLVDTETGFEKTVDEDVNEIANRETMSAVVQFRKSGEYEQSQFLGNAIELVGDLGDNFRDDLLEEYPGMAGYWTDYDGYIAAAGITKGTRLAFRGLTMYSILKNYTLDHYEMLNAVYSLADQYTEYLDKEMKGDEARRAAKEIYKRYQQNNISATIDSFLKEEILNVLQDNAIDTIGNVVTDDSMIWLKTGSLISKAVFEGLSRNGYGVSSYDVAQKAKYLKHYNQLMYTALYSYNFYYYYGADSLISYESLDKMRLCAIMALIASRSLYRAIAESQEIVGNGASLYTKHIDEINETLGRLYLAHNECYTDSEEYMIEQIKKLEGTIKDIATYSNMTDKPVSYWYDQAVFAAAIKAFDTFGEYTDIFFNDADHDGKQELFFAAKLDEKDINSFIVLENVATPAMYYYTYTGGASVLGFLYDDLKDEVVFSESWVSAGHPQMNYCEWTGNNWKLYSSWVRTWSEETSTDLLTTRCMWDNSDVTEEEFQRNEERIKNFENPDIFNQFALGSVQSVSDSFLEYLHKRFQSVYSLYVDIDGDKKEECIIVVDNMLSSWMNNVEALSGEERYIDEANLSTDTVCFIIDQNDDKIRIRSELFPEKYQFTKDGKQLKVFGFDKFEPDKQVEMTYDYNPANATLDSSILTLSPTVKVDQNSNELNWSAHYRGFANGGFYSEPNEGSAIVCTIPDGAPITIISLANGYLSGEWDKLMLYVDYNGQKGYIYSSYALLDISVPESKMNEQKLLELGSALYHQYEQLYFTFEYNGGIRQNGSDYIDGHTRYKPAGLTVKQLMDDFHHYFSSRYDYFYTTEQMYFDMDGYLCSETSGMGDNPEIDHEAVTKIISRSNNEIVFNVRHYYREDFWQFYDEHYYDTEFSVVYEDGLWKCGKLNNVPLNGMTEFLTVFTWYGQDFNSATITPQELAANLDWILDLQRDYYENYPYESHPTVSDSNPRKYWNMDTADVWNGKKVDWMLSNILNIPEQTIREMQTMGADQLGFYYQDGLYYTPQGGFGGIPRVIIESYECNEGIYDVTLLRQMYDYGSKYYETEARYNAKLKKKVIDNKEYWSLISLTELALGY